jgi:hypothetical protein
LNRVSPPVDNGRRHPGGIQAASTRRGYLEFGNSGDRWTRRLQGSHGQALLKCGVALGDAQCEAR